MTNCLVFEDGVLTENSIAGDVIWAGLFSKALTNGTLIRYIQSCLPKNSLLLIPKSDGNINRKTDNKWYNTVNWSTQIQPYIDYANRKQKTFMLGVLCQVDEEKDINYVYLPLDDDIFTHGIQTYFNKNTLITWENRNPALCWRGSCSGIGGLESLRVRFVDTIYKNNPQTDVRLSTWWSDGKQIPYEYFAERIHYSEFLKYKIYFIVDGNCIASNHMYGFATGAIPFYISNGICWFSHLIKPYIHYIPVNYDLSNLIEQIEWVKNNDAEAKIIAHNALQFAETYFSSAYQKKYIKETIDHFCNKEPETAPQTVPLRKIIDCFTFYNELDLLFYRLTILNDIVDKFIIVESNYTHTGHKKPLFFEQNKHLFKRFTEKIIYVVVDLPYIAPIIDFSNNDQWKNENFQRNCIANGLTQIDLAKNDLLIISDLDEITDPTILHELKYNELKYNELKYNELKYNEFKYNELKYDKFKYNKLDITDGGFTLSQDMYYYNLNTIHCEKWTRSKIVTYEKYMTMTPQAIREDTTFPLLMNAGWHLSYFGDKKFIKNKLHNFGHQECNTALYTNEDYIENMINNSKDLFQRSYVPIKYIAIESNTYLPPLFNTYLRNYVKPIQLPTTPIYVYFHICCINNWEEIVSRLFFKLRNSGLYNIVTAIKCVVLGNYNNCILFADPKVDIVYHSLDLSLHEKQSINILYNDCVKTTEEFHVLYLHSKGVKHFNNLKTEKNVSDWTDYLAYFNIYQYNLCLSMLSNCDAVSVNLQQSVDDHIPLHYSGNFWWSKSSHICKLTLIHDTNYYSPEFWITSFTSGVYESLWNSNTHHYDSPYPYYEYENKPIKSKFIEHLHRHKNIYYCKIGYAGAGLCNQLYSLISCIFKCIHSKCFEKIIILDDFLTDINTNIYASVDAIFDLAQMNQYLKKHNICLLSKHDIQFNILSILYGNGSTKLDVTRILSERYLMPNNFYICKDLDLNRIVTDPCPNIKKQVNITYTLNKCEYTIYEQFVENDEINIDFKDFSNVEWHTQNNITKERQANYSLINDLLVNIRFKEKYHTLSNEFINSLPIQPGQAINILHLRNEEDAIPFWGDINNMPPDTYRAVLEDKYIYLIEKYFNKTSLTIILSMNTSNKVLTFMQKQQYKYVFCDKNLVNGREENAIIDLLNGTHCNNIYIGNVNLATYHGSTFSYVLYKLLETKPGIKKILIDLDHINVAEVIVS